MSMKKEEEVNIPGSHADDDDKPPVHVCFKNQKEKIKSRGISVKMHPPETHQTVAVAVWTFAYLAEGGAR